MQSLELDENTGFAKVKIGGVELELDLWKVWADIDSMHAAVNSNPDANIFESVKQYLVGLGFPDRISHLHAKKFLAWHAAAVTELGKEGAGASSPDSPASTELPPSTSPPE